MAAYAFKDGPLAGLDVGASFRYRGMTRTTTLSDVFQWDLIYFKLGATTNPYRYYYAAQFDMGLFASYNVTDNLKVQVNVDNLTDRAFDGPYRAFPRSVFGKLTYTFD